MTINRSTLTGILSVLTIALCAANGLRHCGKQESGDLRTAALAQEQQVGTYCGETVAAAFGEDARVVLLCLEVEVEALEAQLAGMRDALVAGGLEVAAVETLPVEHHVLTALAMLQSGFPGRELDRVRARHPNVDAVISLAGAPLYPPGSARRSSGPKLVVAPFIGDRSLLPPLRAQGLSLVVAQRQDAARLLEASMNPDLPARVRGMYEVIAR